MASLAGPDVRLAELIASISLATDLGLGQPMEHVLRSCILGLRIAEDLELEESERAVVYYVALLAWLGCHADAHEQSAWFGDDIALRADRQFADGPGMPSSTSCTAPTAARTRRGRASTRSFCTRFSPCTLSGPASPAQHAGDLSWSWEATGV